MPTFIDVVRVLRQYEGRYECLDAFVDDIDELRVEASGGYAHIRAFASPHSVGVIVEGDELAIEIFPPDGIARFRLLGRASGRGANDTIGLGAALGAGLGVALGAASDKKEGLLGGLVLGVLVGGLIGAAAGKPAVERALAICFEPATSSWQLYDGPLLRWAKASLARPLSA
jgi:hypothetical protein